VIENVEIRRARAEEEEAALRLIYEPPGPEASGILGGESRARAVGPALQRLGFYRGPDDEVFVALGDGQPVGVLVGRTHPMGRPGAGRALALIRAVLALFPLAELPGLVHRARIRARLDHPLPAGSFHVAELHVAPAWRGRGIGAALLRCAEGEAQRRGFAELSLTTLTSNPARRLYEREGYAVVAERTDPAYERIAGGAGRLLMSKRLAP